MQVAGSRFWVTGSGFQVLSYGPALSVVEGLLVQGFVMLLQYIC